MDKLDSHQEGELLRLKRWIRERQQKSQAETRKAEKKAEEAARQESQGIQSSLFEALQV